MSSLFNQDYLLHICKKYGLSPSKKYGQNYLIDAGVIERIIEVASINKTDTVIEVGPGFGVLTLHLTDRAGQVISFEIEKKLEQYWNKTKADKQLKNLEIIWGNVLHEFASATAHKYKVVANLPYQITSAVIRLFLEAANPPSEMILMVQKEVGERICAKPGDMSLLAISVQYYANPEYLFTVPRVAFWPSPAVDSAVIRISLRVSPLFKEGREGAVVFTGRLFSLVKAGFANKRKLLFKNLLPIIGKQNKTALEQAFQELGLVLTVRAQELSVEQWVNLVYKVIKL